jgi:hypothetical protein
MACADSIRQAAACAKNTVELTAIFDKEPTMRPRLIRSLFAAVLVLAVVRPAAAQFNPYYPSPYYPLYPGSGFGPGATLAGGAQVIQASGQLGIQQEQARQQRQQYYQEKIKTKKMAFDEAAYEKANTPSWTEEQEKVLSMRIRRIMNQPAPAEITRGETLNTLMPFVKSLGDMGTPGPPLTLNPNTLKSINVAVGTSGGGSTGAGVLKNGGRLSWPLQLRGPAQKKIDALLPKAVEQGAAGTLEQKTYLQLQSMVSAMQEDVRKRYHKEEIDGGSYLKGKHFLDDLQSSLKVLQEPEATKFLDGSYAARGANVQELVDNMSAQGLKFAPATPGSEAAYFSLHDSFVSYARAAQSGAGFQSMLAPQGPPTGSSTKKGF